MRDLEELLDIDGMSISKSENERVRTGLHPSDLQVVFPSTSKYQSYLECLDRMAGLQSELYRMKGLLCFCKSLLLVDYPWCRIHEPFFILSMQ